MKKEKKKRKKVTIVISKRLSDYRGAFTTEPEETLGNNSISRNT